MSVCLCARVQMEKKFSKKHVAITCFFDDANKISASTLIPVVRVAVWVLPLHERPLGCHEKATCAVVPDLRPTAGRL